MLSMISLCAAGAAAHVSYLHTFHSRHRSRLDGLQHNIHINGIRGKSTVTRMMGAVLREAGLRTISKTTGTYACVIDCESGEHPIKRTGPANIAEQYSFIREWVTEDVDALVVECMAVKPKYQKVCQETILQSPITVITNVRLDHQEDMGDTLEEITASLCNTVPFNGTVVTAERNPRLVSIIEKFAQERGSRVIVAARTDLSEGLVPYFSYQQFEENVAVVLAVAELIGIDAQTAARGMLTAAPDPGTTAVQRIPVGDSSVTDLKWVPMFAVNDWESTVRVFRSVSAEKLSDDASRVVILNNRSDRTDRAQMFNDLISTDLREEIDRVVLFGDLQDVVSQQLVDNGLPADMVVTTGDLENATGEALLRRVIDGLDGDVAVFGMVNIHTDHATELIRYFDAAATDDAAAGASPVAEEEQSAIAELTSDVATLGYEGAEFIEDHEPELETTETKTAA